MGTVVVSRPDDERERWIDWNQYAKGEGIAYCITPRGGWTRQSPPNYVERSLALLGPTADTARLRDVMAALRTVVRRADGTVPVRIVGRGQGGILAAYAAAFV